MLVDIGEVKRHIKPKADSTLRNMRKDDLIEYIRSLEHNYNVAVSFNKNQAKYIDSLDAAPVVHGRWIDKTVWEGCFGHIRTQCSVCGTVYPNKPGSRGDGKGGKFCEECGAKMDLEEAGHAEPDHNR